MEIYKQRIPKATRILLGMCVVGLSLFIYSKLNAPSRDSVYRTVLSSIYWLGIIGYLICSSLEQKVVVFDDCIQYFRQKIPFEDINEIEIDAHEIVIYRKSTEKWILLRSTQFGSETWNRLANRLRDLPQLPYPKKE